MPGKKRSKKQLLRDQRKKKQKISNSEKNLEKRVQPRIKEKTYLEDQSPFSQSVSTTSKKQGDPQNEEKGGENGDGPWREAQGYDSNAGLYHKVYSRLAFIKFFYPYLNTLYLIFNVRRKERKSSTSKWVK